MDIYKMLKHIKRNSNNIGIVKEGSKPRVKDPKSLARVYSGVAGGVDPIKVYNIFEDFEKR